MTRLEKSIRHELAPYRLALRYCGVKPLNLLMGIQAAKINVIIDFLNILWYNITRNEVI